MKKFLLSSLFALLVLAGGANFAHAISIPDGEDPKNGPAVWTVPVVNNSASTLSAGAIVVWDITNSTDKNDNYVTTTTTADTSLVAGVIFGNSIAAGGTGTMAVHGVVPVTMAGGGNVVNGPICTSGLAGQARSCGDDDKRVGVTTTVTSSGTAQVFLEVQN